MKTANVVTLEMLVDWLGHRSVVDEVNVEAVQATG